MGAFLASQTEYIFGLFFIIAERGHKYTMLSKYEKDYGERKYGNRKLNAMKEPRTAGYRSQHKSICSDGRKSWRVI